MSKPYSGLTEEQKEHKRAIMRAYLKAHPEQREKSRVRLNTWLKANPGKKRALNIAWEKSHPERAKASRRKWRKANPEREIAQVHKRNARIAGNGGSFTAGEWELLKERYGYRCPACGKSEPEIKLTVDHIVPISKGGVNSIVNIQPLCLKCNSRKHIQIARFDVNGQPTLF